MTITVSDVIPAAEVAAELRGSPTTVDDSAARAQTRGRDGRANARASIPVTQRVGRRIAADLSGSWVWRDVPPSLKQVIADRRPARERAPSGSRPLHVVWAVWNVVVAVPASAVLYVLAWLLQHPARAGVLALVVGPLGVLWITNK